MSKYLLKIEFDCNDADYVYGCQIIDEEMREIIDENGDKEVSFGSYDFSAGNNRTIDECMSYTEISDEQAAVLVKLGLDSFGETWDGSFDEPEDEDEDFDDDEQ